MIKNSKTQPRGRWLAVAARRTFPMYFLSIKRVEAWVLRLTRVTMANLGLMFISEHTYWLYRSMSTATEYK